MVCESIKLIHVTKCSMLRRLPLSLHMDNEQATAPPALKCITGGEEWWESIVWDHRPTKFILEPFLERGKYCSVVSDLLYGELHPGKLLANFSINKFGAIEALLGGVAQIPM